MSLDVISREDARATGSKRFFDGLTCKNGHVAERYVLGGNCTQCKAEKARSIDGRAYQACYRKENAEKAKECSRKHYEQNIEARREYGRRYYAENTEAKHEYDRRYNAENAAYRREYGKAYRNENYDSVRASQAAWRKSNPDKARVNGQNRRSRDRAAEGRHTAAEIADLMLRQKCKCANCNASLKNGYHADHIDPLSRGGSNWISNIQLLCPACNMRKHNKDPIQFAQENGRLL